MTNQLLLGPVLRHVDETSASLWVETAEAGRVRVVAGEVSGEAPTFAVHGHHYALVCLDGLTKGTNTPYTVSLDDHQVWPEAHSPFPPSVVPTLDHAKPLRLAFGSCRTSVPHDLKGNRKHGIDALRAYALRMAGISDHTGDDDPDPGSQLRWPDLVLFLGDQVYADETTEEMRAFIQSRRDIEQPPWTELADYEEYAFLYRTAWSDEANRWLLSTLPSAMIFDDHDIRDDWNTSQAWKDEMEATDWWHGRIVAGLASYWVYQHLGNLSPADRAEDPVWQRIVGHAGPGEYDASTLLDEFADRADQVPESYRWSYARDFGEQASLIVIDSRAARVLDPAERSILDHEEMAWLDERIHGDVDHLLIGTSLPFLLAPGLHYVEAFSEALADGVWGRLAGRVGERIRQEVDLEHWAAFQDGFQKVCAMVLETARGERGRAPRTVTFLSGDVHHSYVSEAEPSGRGEGAKAIQSRILQAVCSPIRNPLPRSMRFLTAFLSYGAAGVVGYFASRSAHVPPAPVTWRLRKGPWFDNNLATLEITDAGLHIWWARGAGGDADPTPRLSLVADVVVG